MTQRVNLILFSLGLCLGLVGSSVPVQADNQNNNQSDSLSITLSPYDSTLDHVVTAEELLGQSASLLDYRIRGVIEISNSSVQRSVYAFVSSTVLPLSQGTSKFYVNLSGTIGSTPIGMIPTLIHFSGKQAQIDITGQVNSAGLNLYLKPGVYAGTLIITTTVL